MKKAKLKEFHRDNILDAAKRLFIEKGFTQATMDDIAKEADYSKSTIYVYFKSKDEIYNNIIYDNMLLLEELLEEAISSNDTVKSRFLAICNAHIFLQEENPLFFESMINSRAKKSEDEPIYKKMLDVNNDINNIIIRFMTIGVENKLIKPDIDLKQTAFALWASICGIVLVSYNKQPYLQYLNVSRQEFLNNGFNILFNSISI